MQPLILKDYFWGEFNEISYMHGVYYFEKAGNKEPIIYTSFKNNNIDSSFYDWDLLKRIENGLLKIINKPVNCKKCLEANMFNSKEITRWDL